MNIQNDAASNNSFFIDIFFSLVNFIVEKNSQLNLTVDTLTDIKSEPEYDQNIFFKAGQLLMFLYVFSVSNLTKDNIQYNNGDILLDLCEDNFQHYRFCDTDSESISYDIIRKSIYSKKCFPEDIKIDSLNIKKNFNDFIRGFEICYNTFLDEKINILRLLEDSPLKDKYFNIIKNIKLLTPHDMKIQVKLIYVKLGINFEKDIIDEKINYIKNSNNQFIDLSIQILEYLIENSIIGIASNGLIEVTWLRYIGRTLMPVGPERIYLALFFAYISKITENTYYLHCVYNILTPLFTLRYSDYTKIKDDRDIQKAIYLLNSYISYPRLNSFINNNPDLLKLISKDDKKNCIANGEKLMLEYIKKQSIEIFKSLILV